MWGGPNSTIFRTGDAVQIRYAGTVVNGEISLASGNGKSLMLTFEGLLGVYLGSMPVLVDPDGFFRDLLFWQYVAIEKADGGS